ncbi:MAG: Rieske 2Fe-2S domain-containing protein [Chitinophagaceae bacterium]|nr:Rieske 2Fe-2S domain-containing protein [Chitinophagaceae bacterium]
MASKKYTWHKVAGAATDLQWTAGAIAEVSADGTKICLAKFQDQWFGFAHTCPHAGAPMTDGYVAGPCQVVCPVHQLKFNLKNGGRDVNGEGYTLKTYPVEVRADGVYVGLEEAGGKGFFKKWF